MTLPRISLAALLPVVAACGDGQPPVIELSTTPTGIYQAQTIVNADSCTWSGQPSSLPEAPWETAVFVEDPEAVGLVFAVERSSLVRWDLESTEGRYEVRSSTSGPCGDSSLHAELIEASDGLLRAALRRRWTDVDSNCEPSATPDMDCELETEQSWSLVEACEPPCEMIQESPLGAISCQCPADES